MLRVALIDLDDTLYGAETGLWPAIGLRIEQYMADELGLAAESVPGLRRRYFEQYGTTLNGLVAEQGIDPAGYLRYVHDLPLERYLQPTPALDAMLARLPLTKAIFTNADAAHARRVMACLGVAHHFETIVDIEAMNYRCKPDPAAYARALEMVGATAAECVYADDSMRNLIPARAQGMTTVLVGQNQSGGADFGIQSILGLEDVVAAVSRLPMAEGRAA
jgi:putative hydrolase of the HAD superfamily